MNSITKSERSKGASDFDYSSDDVPLKRVLGLHRNVEIDSLTFQVKSRGKPRTRQGILSVINSIQSNLGFRTQFVLEGCLKTDLFESRIIFSHYKQ